MTLMTKTLNIKGVNFKRFTVSHLLRYVSWLPGTPLEHRQINKLITMYTSAFHSISLPQMKKYLVGVAI